MPIYQNWARTNRSSFRSEAQKQYHQTARSCLMCSLECICSSISNSILPYVPRLLQCIAVLFLGRSVSIQCVVICMKLPPSSYIPSLISVTWYPWSSTAPSSETWVRTSYNGIHPAFLHDAIQICHRFLNLQVSARLGHLRHFNLTQLDTP